MTNASPPRAGILWTVPKARGSQCRKSLEPTAGIFSLPSLAFAPSHVQQSPLAADVDASDRRLRELFLLPLSLLLSLLLLISKEAKSTGFKRVRGSTRVTGTSPQDGVSGYKKVGKHACPQIAVQRSFEVHGMQNSPCAEPCDRSPQHVPSRSVTKRASLVACPSREKLCRASPSLKAFKVGKAGQFCQIWAMSVPKPALTYLSDSRPFHIARSIAQKAF